MTLVFAALALLAVAIFAFGCLCRVTLAFYAHYAVFRARRSIVLDPPPLSSSSPVPDAFAAVKYYSRSRMDSPTDTVLIEDITLPSLLTSFSTSSSVEFSSSDSESETTRMMPILKQKIDKFNNNGPTKSYSLADLSSLKHFKPLILREDSAIYSTETLTSAMTNRTEPGILRSNSCSIVKNNRYSHVESKVKQYIKDIKENEAKSKAKRYSLQPVFKKPLEEKSVEDIIQSKDEEIMLLKKTLKKQEIQLLEKNRLIEQLKYNYRLMEDKYNSATDIILRLAKPSRDVLKYTKNELIEPLSPGLSIPPPDETWGHGYKLQSSNTLGDIQKEKNIIVRRVKSGCDLISNSHVDTYKTLRDSRGDSRSAIHKVRLWQKSLPSTDVSEITTEQEEELQSPHSYSASSNDVSLSSLEITPLIRNKYAHKQEYRSDSSGCGMSSTRVSKENTLVSGANLSVDGNKLMRSPSERVKIYSSTPVKSSCHDLYSSRIKDKQSNESPKLKRRSTRNYRRTKSMSESSFYAKDTDECFSQFQHAIGAINGVVTQMEQSLTSHR